MYAFVTMLGVAIQRVRTRMIALNALHTGCILQQVTAYLDNLQKLLESFWSVQEGRDDSFFPSLC